MTRRYGNYDAGLESSYVGGHHLAFTPPVKKKEKGTVKSVMSKDDYYSMLIEEILDEGFNNSLSEFIQVFIKRKNFSDNEIDEIIEVITKK